MDALVNFTMMNNVSAPIQQVVAPKFDWTLFNVPITGGIILSVLCFLIFLVMLVGLKELHKQNELSWVGQDTIAAMAGMIASALCFAFFTMIKVLIPLAIKYG